MKILLVDDHKIMRDGIKSLLSDCNYEIIEAGNGKEALSYLRENSVDIVFTDINMPVMDGVEFCKELSQDHPNTKILVITMHGEHDFIEQMLEYGASGYILKNSGKEELLRAIETIMAGEYYFSIEATKQMMMKYSNSKSAHEKAVLSEREKEILSLIAMEYTNQEIADKLFLSHRTVDSHRRNLLQKIGAKNTAGLVKYAMENNLVKIAQKQKN